MRSGRKDLVQNLVAMDLDVTNSRPDRREVLV
jgi:hypothetical protein